MLSGLLTGGEPRLPVTLFSCAHSDVLRRNLVWLRDPDDRRLLAAVQGVLEPAMNRPWPSAAQPAQGGAA